MSERLSVENVPKEAVRAAIIDRVCKYCVDRQEDGPPCEIGGSTCCVFGHLERVFDAVTSTSDSGMQPYLLTLRKKVCSGCESVHDDGSCALRTATLCPLNNYFPMVVEAIETTVAEQSEPQ